MTAFFLLSFDLSVYYTLIMYLADVILGIPSFAAGWVFLQLMITLYSLRITYMEDRQGLNVLCVFVPLLSFLFQPSLLPEAMILPVWLWLGIRMFRMDYDMDYASFRRLASRILLIEFILALALFFLPRWSRALIASVPYFSIQLCVSVCSLRYLRQQRTGGLSSLAVTGLVMLVSLLAGLSGFFSRLASLAARVYLWLASKLLEVVIPGEAPQIAEFEFPEAVMPEIGGDPLPSEGGAAHGVIAAMQEMSLFEKILIVLVVVIAVLAVVFFLLHFMKGQKYYRRRKNDDITEKIEGKKKNRLGLFAPSDHRGAVRWYYACYIRECRRRGILLTPEMNSEQVEAADDLLDEETSHAFRQLYIRCRYSSQPVSAEDVKLAKQYYRSAKSAARA